MSTALNEFDIPVLMSITRIFKSRHLGDDFNHNTNTFVEASLLREGNLNFCKNSCQNTFGCVG